MKEAILAFIDRMNVQLSHKVETTKYLLIAIALLPVFAQAKTPKLNITL